MSTKNAMAFGIVSVEWDNSKSLIALEAGLALLALLALGFLNTIFLAEGNLALAATTQFLMILIVFATAIFALEKVGERVKEIDIFETVGFGKKTFNFIIAILVGLVFAIAINFSNFSVITPAIQSIIDVGTQNLLFIVILAAFIEELFFRGTLLPTTVKILLGLKVPFAAEIGLVLQALLFGLYHLGVILVVNPEASIFDIRIIASFLFGLIAGIGNGLFQSTGFSYSAHFFNNLFFVFNEGLI